MFEGSRTDDWDLAWFCEPFAGSRGGLDDPATVEDLERLLEAAAERHDVLAGGHGSGRQAGSA